MQAGKAVLLHESVDRTLSMARPGKDDPVLVMSRDQMEDFQLLFGEKVIDRDMFLKQVQQRLTPSGSPLLSACRFSAVSATFPQFGQYCREAIFACIPNIRVDSVYKFVRPVGKKHPELSPEEARGLYRAATGGI